MSQKLSDYDFTLPPQSIAQMPAFPRDSARLLRVQPAGLQDGFVGDLPQWLRRGDVLVMNDTAVIPARLFVQRAASRVEILLHKPEGAMGEWLAFARPARRLKIGERIFFADDFSAHILDKREDGQLRLDFAMGFAELLAQLQRYGSPPLPPYIERKAALAENAGGDVASYQTLYAKNPGAVAAPTAGLHFTEKLFAALDAAGIGRVMLTLHVGAGTFLPVRVEDVDQHVMHSEWGSLSEESAQVLEGARAAGGRLVAVGTTSLRLLETAARLDGKLRAFCGDTDLFIRPGFKFRAADLLLTNFHLPRSTLFMLVSAFSGLSRMQAAYQHAIAAGYRFYSYGDACLLEPCQQQGFGHE